MSDIYTYRHAYVTKELEFWKCKRVLRDNQWWRRRPGINRWRHRTGINRVIGH